ncbi:hypothetical protein [Sediminibacterium goheungense]|uniref:Novel STAND NTPase 3 domain-containing protein n=1 Tax=Sediminibacterium goheungense TaxID=1086393 RepID=A0A4R6ISB0_9BACT|nr:hypothetical protein [Sediminibacterium goheungense]TDO25359.1 hypothetical protein BC659_2899 [Sediminibacterium goheungense]
MSSRLQLIEQKLTTLGGAEFQVLCDEYIGMREEGLSGFHRYGTQFGKEKTRPGTPDTFYRTAKGDLVFVEYTTQADDLVSKLKGDIDKCLDEEKTNVPVSDITKIELFFNSRLTLEEERTVYDYAKSKRIPIMLIDQGWLAQEIYTKYLVLSQHLGIPLDTGQIQTIEKFIQEYTNKGGSVSTPLDNPFFYREKEKKEIESALNSDTILILEGSPGVGKTKIALQAITEFLQKNISYKGYVIARKDQDIADDLKIHLHAEKNYILLIDDANRQAPNFRQLLGYYRQLRKGNLKIILTVRNYALEEIRKYTNDLPTIEIPIAKFSDQEILEIVSQEPFKIITPQYQTRVVMLADGNIRLAIMAARLANKIPGGAFLYGTLSEIYDDYFKNFVHASTIFSNPDILKAIGIISFFFSVNKKDKSFITTLLNLLELDYYKFQDALFELEQRELVESQFETVRISDQVMATYFFHKVFIKNKLLSFEILLKNYFPEYKQRFSDSIIPSHNMFGHQAILNEISSILDKYHRDIKNDLVLEREYFDFFWFFKRIETLDYINTHIQNIPFSQNPVYETDYSMNAFSFTRDRCLDMLSKFFPYDIDSFLPSLQLSFEYVKRKPEALPELIYKIREKLIFDQPDQDFGFARQVKLFGLLVKETIKKNPVYVKSFLALTPTFLAHHYQITKGAKNNAITFYQYPIPLNPIIRNFRKKIWDALFALYIDYPVQVMGIIQNFSPGLREPDKNIWEYDLQFILPFLKETLCPGNIKDAEYVYELNDRMKRLGITKPELGELKAKLETAEFKYAKALDWNYVRGKSEFDAKNLHEYRAAKEKQLREEFVFQDKNKFDDLFVGISNILLINNNQGYVLQQPLNVILDENLKKEFEIGFSLFERLIKQYPPQMGLLTEPVRYILNTNEKNINRLYRLLETTAAEIRDLWLLNFFCFLPEKYITEEYTKQLLELVAQINDNRYIPVDELLKFEKFDSNLLKKIITSVVRSISDKNYRTSLSYHFFENYAERLKEDFDLLTEAYFQQETITDHYDFSKKGLQQLVSIKPEFLITYINKKFHEKSWETTDADDNLTFIWSLNLPYAMLSQVADRIIESTYPIGEHALNRMFQGTPPDQQNIAFIFLDDYFTQSIRNYKKIEAIVNVLKYSFPSKLNNYIKKYLELNPDPMEFQKIEWIGTGGVYSGDIIIGELRAKDWEEVLKVVTNMEDQIAMLPIARYIKSRIEDELRSAEQEKERKFINPRW